MRRYRQNERRYKGVSQRGWYRGFILIPEFSRPRMKQKCFFPGFFMFCPTKKQTVDQIVQEARQNGICDRKNGEGYCRY